MISKLHDSRAYGLAFSPDSRILASSGEDGLVRLWDTSTGERVPSGICHQMGSWSVDFSPNGQLIATACDDGSVQIWRVGNGTECRFVHSFHHSTEAWAVAFSSDGKYLVSGSADQTVRIWHVSGGASVRTMHGHARGVLTVTFSPDGSLIASASDDGTARIWETSSGQCIIVLEGHVGDVTAAYFSFDGRLLATKSLDSRVMLWRSDTWERVAEFTEPMLSKWRPALAFHPKLPILATLGEADQSIRTWDINIDELVGALSTTKVIGYVSAKVVIVGEANVGKSCLAMRLAEDRYPEDHEQGTTHGMRFWLMEAEDLHPPAKSPEGQRRDVVLWDFGGQDEYQLVHQMFLHDTTLALVLIDPTRGRAALDEAREWNKRLEKHLSGRQAVKLLVGAKQDRPSELVNRQALIDLCRECGFDEYVETSSKTGRNIDELRESIAEKLDWQNLGKTSRPEMFQQIRDEIANRQRKGEIVATLDDVWTTAYQEAAVKTVASQLAMQGVVVQTRLTCGDDVLVLQLPVIERYAGSLIIAARNNPRGVPVLEERLLGSATGHPATWHAEEGAARSGQRTDRPGMHRRTDDSTRALLSTRRAVGLPDTICRHSK